MTTFTDLESLQRFLRQDSKQISLNPVRFINVDSLEMWVAAKKLLLSLADETMPLSKFCEGRDTTPNIRRVGATLKKVNKSQLVYPLSEYLRVIPEEAGTVIQRFIKADYQNNDTGKTRFYFLMYRMKSILRTIPSDDPRAEDSILLLETDPESDYKLTVIQEDLDVKLEGNEISGFQSYLEYWEANPNKPLILHTGNAIHFEKNHFIDDVRVIVSSYDLIRFQFGLPHGIDEALGSNGEWAQLAKAIIRERSFENACCAELAINRYSSALFERWNHFTPFQRWLLWLWTRQQSGTSYEIAAAKACKSVSDLVDEMYCCVMDMLRDERITELYEERKNILASMQAVPTERFWTRLDALDKVDALSCLTCLTDMEQKKIFEIIADFDYQKRNRVLPTLKRVYLALYYYLQNDKQPNAAGLSPEHERYFDEYKWLKATDAVSASFVDEVRRIALEKGASVFQMKPRNHYVSEHYDDQTAVLFVDGMGVEYADYLAYLFSDLDEQQYSVTLEAGFCTLPSVTEINKDFLLGRNTVEPPVRELDELKHANNVHPESLVKQLQILDGIKNRVLGLLIGSTHRIIITADHGTSRLAVKVRNTEYDNIYPKPKDRGVYKYGRFCEGTEDEPNYPTAINYNERLIFADYSRFVQNGAPIDEIHGGASLEEWIVPIITVERFAEGRPETAEIKPMVTKLKPEPSTKQVNVQFTVSGKKRETVSARIKGKQHPCLWLDGVYSFSFVPARNEGKLTVKVIDNGILGSFDIEIEQGIKKNDNFDI